MGKQGRRERWRGRSIEKGMGAEDSGVGALAEVDTKTKCITGESKIDPSHNNMYNNCFTLMKS